MPCKPYTKESWYGNIYTKYINLYIQKSITTVNKNA